MIPEMLGMKNHCDWRRRLLKKAWDTVAKPLGSDDAQVGQIQKKDPNRCLPGVEPAKGKYYSGNITGCSDTKRVLRSLRSPGSCLQGDSCCRGAGTAPGCYAEDHEGLAALFEVRI